MSKVTGHAIREQAAVLLGVDIGERRAGEIAADIGRIGETLHAVRELLDFNDEPARFIALLCSPAATSASG